MGRWMMTDKRKKLYVKAELRQTWLQLGVYGCYSDGDTEQPNMPFDLRGRTGGVDPRS